MADNVIANAGAGGATFRTDDDGTAHWPYTKLAWGADNTQTIVAVGASAIPIQDGGNSITVDGAVTVSGTVTTTPPANASENLAQVGGTNVDVNSGLKSAGTLRVVLATDQPQLTNKLLVTPDSVALPANQSVNVAQVAGTATDVNSGVKSAGTIRVVLATDQPQLTNKLLVTPDSVALPANQSVNVAQINGVTPLMGSGNTGTGSPRVTLATDQPNLTTDLNVKDVPQTSGGLSFTYVLSAASNNKTQVKGSAGQLYCVVVTNTNASPRYLKVFNNTSAGVTMGTTVADYQFVIPGNASGAGVAINIDKGIAMGTGITIAITTGVSLTDNTSTAANEQSVLVGYK